jgi:hypothetical protein
MIHSFSLKEIYRMRCRLLMLPIFIVRLAATATTSLAATTATTGLAATVAGTTATMGLDATVAGTTAATTGTTMAIAVASGFPSGLAVAHFTAV